MYSDLIGRPWACPCDPPNSFDCWGLVVEVRKRLGLPTPHYLDAPERTMSDTKAFETPPVGCFEVSEPKRGVVVLFGAPAHHCGIMLNECDMMHSYHVGDVGAVRIDNMRFAKRLYRTYKFWDFET